MLVSAHFRWIIAPFAAALLILGAGCSRQHYRERADREVAGIVSQKNIFPDWKVDDWHVYPDARSRFADPACPDNPPYPPDDHAAWLLSPNPQHPNKTSGSGRHEGTEYLKFIEAWDAENRARDAAEKADAKKRDGEAAKTGESPAVPELAASATGYLSAVRTTENPYRLTIEQAVELAAFNSREMQDRREDLYIAALPVTNERFSFAAQGLASLNLAREVAGRENPDAGSRWRIDSGVGINRLFPTGGQLIVRLANTLVLDLTSSRPDISLSNLSLSFVQPLLRGGGFAVTLEALTQAERTLLYAIRSYARFRKVFYTAVAAAGDYTNNPYGLAGLSVNLGRGIGVNLTATSVGFLPTALRAATLANERKNILALEQNLKLIENLKEGGSSTQLQVIQAEQQLLTSRATFLTNSRTYLDQLDNFKLQLGVPATMPIELDDAPLKPMRQQLTRFDELYKNLGDFQTAGAAFVPGEDEPTLRARWLKLLTESALARGTPAAKEYPEKMAELAKITDEALRKRITALSALRQKQLDARADRQLAGKDETPAQIAILEATVAAIDLAQFEKELRTYSGRPWLRFPAERRSVEQVNSYRAVADAGTLVGLRARNQRQDSVRSEWPTVPPLSLESVDLLAAPLDEAATAASQAALTNRLDLMNTRAQLVDSYRQIAVQANALQGYLDVRYDLTTSSLANANVPLALGGSRTKNSVSLRVDPPLVRRAERNQYRASLIAYQRQRRFLMAVEDNVVNDVRSDLRQLRIFAESYKLQQRAVELAYAQVDSARGTLLAPPDPTERESAGNVAALTDQLLRAQAQLLLSQNALYTVWINYLNARTAFYLDIEILPLDARGVWTDDALPRLSPSTPDAKP